MRILFINSIQMFAGGEVWMLNTLRALQQRGHHVWLCCRPGVEVGDRAAEMGIPVKLVPFGSDFGLFNILRLWLFMRRHRIDVVLTNMDKELRIGGVAARLANVPAIIPRRGIDYPLKDRWRYRFAYNILATRIIANSQATKRTLLRRAPWLNPDRVEVIYNGIDPSRFDTPTGRDLRREWGIDDRTPLLGFVGQLDERKGIGVLLTAFGEILQAMPGVRLVMVGRGPLQEMVESEIKMYGWQNAIILTGFEEDIASVMQAIDVLLLPSYWEGFGIVLIEAMAAGKPAISTATSSMPEIVADGETGFLIEPGDAEALAQRSVELLQDGPLRRRFGAAAQQRVKDMFTLDTMISRLESFFAEQIARRRRATTTETSG
jgi:glycosyltransferase involved in cell wall biosynthesis